MVREMRIAYPGRRGKLESRMLRKRARPVRRGEVGKGLCAAEAHVRYRPQDGKAGSHGL